MAEQRVAIITARGSGMGAAAAKRLAADGFMVSILASAKKGEALLPRSLAGLALPG